MYKKKKVIQNVHYGYGKYGRTNRITWFPLTGSSSDKRDLFDLFNSDSSPFDIATEETVEEDIMANGDTMDSIHMSDDDSEDDEELMKDFVDEQTGEAPHPHTRRKFDHSKVRIDIIMIFVTITISLVTFYF